MSETKKLRGACIQYLGKKGRNSVDMMALNTLDLLKEVAKEHAKEMGAKGIEVTYHFENDLR